MVLGSTQSTNNCKKRTHLEQEQEKSKKRTNLKKYITILNIFCCVVVLSGARVNTGESRPVAQVVST